MTDRLCIKCKHYRASYYSMCQHPNLGTSPVSGLPKDTTCEYQREYGLFNTCGASGSWWEPIPEDTRSNLEKSLARNS